MLMVSARTAPGLPRIASFLYGRPFSTKTRVHVKFRSALDPPWWSSPDTRVLDSRYSMRTLAALTLIFCIGLARAQGSEWEALDREALSLYRRADDIGSVEVANKAVHAAERAFGPDHPKVAASLNQLADSYGALARYAQAEPLFQRALAIREKALGPDHRDVATSLNNLAALYELQGRYAETGSLFQRALAIREKALGPDHPTVALSLYELGTLHYLQRDYNQAEPLFRRSLAIREKTLGPSDPELARNFEKMAELYRGIGKEQTADEFAARAAAIRASKR
jgi:tetratricopeptide (TPR) repeat protein